MRLVITGATGYIGTYFTELASKHGHELLILARTSFDLLSNDIVKLPSDTAVVVHLAANTNNAQCIDEKTEVLAAQRLIKSAEEVGAKFVYISSQAARPDAPTAYGRIKWKIEQNVLYVGGLIVRPGQVYGGALNGLFGTLVKITLNSPILPAFYPAPKVQPIHVEDLAQGLLNIVERSELPSGIYCLAASEAILFSIFLKQIAKYRLRCWRIFLPLPIWVVNLIAACIGQNLRAQLGLARLQSLFNLPLMNTKDDLTTLDLSLRPLSVGMQPSGDNRRRLLLKEGRTLFIYILKKNPPNVLLRRYVKVIEQLRDGRAMDLTQTYLKFPILLSLIIESEEFWGAEFAWRLDAATVLGEATPCGAYRFLGLGDHNCGVLLSLFLISKSIFCEVLWRILRIVSSICIRKATLHKKEVI